MEAIEGLKIQSLDILELKKITDILEYDGPILSHFVDKFNKDYLFYWVDYNESYNRWLIWKVFKIQIAAYLNAECSLKDLILSEREDCYIVDIDENLKYDNITQINKTEIPETYLPEEKSYYLLEPDELYLESLVEKEVEQNSNEVDAIYIKSIKRQAIYFKMEPKSRRFGNTVSFKDAGDFFKNVCLSLTEYYKYFYFNDFKDNYFSTKSLNNAINSFIDTISPRVAHTKLGSLEVGLAIDTIQISEKRLKEWQFEKLKEYNRDVIELDLNKEENILLIEEKYPIDVRNKIFKPIIDLRNSKSFTIQSSNNTVKYKKLSFVSEFSKNRLVSKPDFTEPAKIEKEFVVVYLEVPKNTNVSDLKKQEINKGMLFSELTNHISIPLSEIKTDRIIIKLKAPLYVNVYNNLGSYELEVKDSHISTASESREKGLTAIIFKLVDLFNSSYDDFNGLFAIDSVEYIES